MSNRDRLRDLIAERAVTAAKQEQTVDISALALELSTRYPQSGITIDRICAEIEAAIRDARAGTAHTAA